MIVTPEFSRPFAVDRLGPAGVAEEVVANAAECAALAPRLGIPAVEALRCRFRLRRGEDGRVHAEAVLTARLVRECVVSLDAFGVSTEEAFRIDFVPAGRENDDDDPESDDEIAYDGGLIDLGEAAAEQLALTLDPYPHKPGAALPEATGGDPESPFAALARRSRDG